MITALMQCGIEAISLWFCCIEMGAQVALIVAFRSSALLGLVYHLPLDSTPYILCGVQVRPVCQPVKQSNTMITEPAFSVFGRVGRCQVLLGNEIGFFIRLFSRRKQDVL
ncbi:hypothetical protein ILYODFUR_038328 [Ilyodon furcidens]|uniref:Secreted protein n=1 Tax=Ilyodon furcidens TaxID=33524 RepID=A0ABV0U453_9TELE